MKAYKVDKLTVEIYENRVFMGEAAAAENSLRQRASSLPPPSRGRLCRVSGRGRYLPQIDSQAALQPEGSLLRELSPKGD